MTHHLHARAALWSLRRSWPALRGAYADVRRRARTERVTGDGGTLRSQVWGTIGRTGGHGDPVASAVSYSPAEADVGRYRRAVEMVAEETAAARWLTASVHGELMRLMPARARDVAGYLAAADRAARRVLSWEPDHRALVTNPPCPGCGTRMLRTQTSAPDSALWTVVCTAGCRDDSGAVRIWDAGSPVVAGELAELVAA